MRKKSILALMVSMLFCLVLVSCDDDPDEVRLEELNKSVWVYVRPTGSDYQYSTQLMFFNGKTITIYGVSADRKSLDLLDTKNFSIKYGDLTVDGELLGNVDDGFVYYKHKIYYKTSRCLGDYIE
ncbi:MAG: hypothetical protein NC127_04630 [Muribaculum sp.]|nr:hypothetical protein [Muribaculum sp.]